MTQQGQVLNPTGYDGGDKSSLLVKDLA